MYWAYLDRSCVHVSTHIAGSTEDLMLNTGNSRKPRCQAEVHTPPSPILLLTNCNYLWALVSQKQKLHRPELGFI